MQKTKFLHKKELDLIDTAKNIIKKAFKKDLTSMTSVLLTKKGNIYSGVNVKYKNVWKCICAERVAIANAVQSSDLNFDTIVTVKFFPNSNSFKVINMCGECLQMAINHKGLKVIVDHKGVLKPIPINKILPYSYI